MSEIKNIKKTNCFKKTAFITIGSLLFLYLILLIPDPEPSFPDRAQKQPFAWNRDSLWSALEHKFIKAKQGEPSQHFQAIDSTLVMINDLLGKVKQQELKPDAPQFHQLEHAMFTAAPLIGATHYRRNDYINLFSQLRIIIKNQSHSWDMNSLPARHTIYRLLYGGRAAIEEIMLQAPKDSIQALVKGVEEPSQTPNASILGITLHSGDILVSRGGAPTSALIARGNDYPGNFSHVALVHVDEKTHLISVIESHIEIGVAVATLDQYMKDAKLRIMVLRLRSDLPLLKSDPMLPHKAAEFALHDAQNRHIPYDFEMDFSNSDKLFCSEVASAAYKHFGINLWMGISNISKRGIARWLADFGVKYFKTQEPSDLEYDPQLTVVAEWRDPETLYKDHIDNAVIEVMLQYAEKGRKIGYPIHLLPFARISKLYSIVLNTFGSAGPLPEGMSATSGLKNKQLSEDHEAIKTAVISKIEAFREQNGYTPPYWKMMKFTEQTMEEIGY